MRNAINLKTGWRRWLYRNGLDLAVNRMADESLNGRLIHLAGSKFLSIFIVCIVGVFLLGVSRGWAGEIITPQEAYDRLQRDEIVLIDIRRPSEWEDTGTPLGAIPLSMHREGGIKDFIAEIDSRAGRGNPIALICAGGVRSRYLQWRLGQFGVEDVIDVTEGVVGGPFSKGWKGRDLPMVPYVAEKPSAAGNPLGPVSVQS